MKGLFYHLLTSITFIVTAVGLKIDSAQLFLSEKTKESYYFIEQCKFDFNYMYLICNFGTIKGKAGFPRIGAFKL